MSSSEEFGAGGPASDVTPGIPPVARVSPPTAPVTARAVAEPAARWPFAVGVISIGYAGLHILGGICSVATPLWSGLMRNSSPPGAGPDFAAITERWASWTVTLSVVSLGLSGLLLAVGIGMLNRRRWSIGVSRYWCAGQMVLAAANSVYGYLFQADMVHTMSQSASGASVAFAAGARIGASVGVVAGLVWGFGLPVFLLVWLSRSAVRREYERWAGGGVR